MIGQKITPKLSVIISSLNEPSHLWSTVCSFKEQALDCGESTEIVVGDNAPDKINPCRGRLTGVKWVPINVQSTSLVRNLPAREADGEILCFSDTHVILGNSLLKRALYVFDNDKDLGLLHTHTVFWGNGDGYYSYKLDLKDSFCGSNYNKNISTRNLPYCVPASGHGLFFIRRSLFEKIGGYLETQLGWGGEEIFLDLLVWMYGYYVMVDPMMKHWHLPGEFSRPYRRNGVQYILNHIRSAYVLGGDCYFNQVCNHYKLMEYELVSHHSKIIPIENCARREKVIREAKYTLPEIEKVFDDIGMDWRDYSCVK